VIAAAGNYCRAATGRFAEGWNRFWFAPSDPLPLGVLRWLVGLLATYVVGSYGFELLRYFGPNGMLPVETIREISGPYRLSFLDFARDATSLYIFYGISMLVLASFTVGLGTRYTSIAAFVVYMSFFQRAPILTTVVEPVVAMLLLYLCLGPSGATLSVDALLRKRKSPAVDEAAKLPSYRATIALRLIQVHTVIAYFMMFSGKSHGNFIWWNGTAVWWLIARPGACLVDLRWLYDSQYVINLWTTAIVAFELAFAVLIWNRTARPLLIVVSAVMWTGTAILTGLVPFCLAMFTAGLAFVSADQWNDLCGCERPATSK
jgi:hypothetical protein